MSKQMKKQGNNVNTYTPGKMDTKLGYPMACRLQILYKRKMKEEPGSIEKIRIKKFARFIGKVFKIKVPKIKVVKQKKLERKYKQKGLFGVTETNKSKCKKICLAKEIVKSGDAELIYLVLSHELRHCWQAKDYLKYYGEQEDTTELQVFREADAQAFAELVMFYLFGSSKSYEEVSGVDCEQIKNAKNAIRVEFWDQIKRYFRFHGGFRNKREIRKIDREIYKGRK